MAVVNGGAAQVLSGVSEEGYTQEAALEAGGFSFRYPSSQKGIGPLDWCVKQGSFCLLVGATGSGKTTLLRCAKPAIAPAGQRTGVLTLYGRDTQELTDLEAATLVGYVSQSPENQMVCDTVWHELAFGLENIGIEQDAMRRRVAEVAHFFGIEPWFHREVAALSGGQKQMVNLAGVLAMQPQLLMLDEPTAQLDPVAAKNFLHALFRVNRELGITVIVATHAPETMVDYATDAVELVEGKIFPVSLERFIQRPLDVALCVSSKASTLLSASCARASHCTPAQGKQVVRSGSSTPPLIALEDVFVRYGRGDAWVLHGCTLAVQPRHIHALVGGNGCGKSTLLRLAGGILKPERGRVRNGAARQQAFLPQDPKTLFVRDSVLDELREWQQSCGYGEDAITEMLERMDLAGHAAHHPYDLSGGQQQKLALAKLLLTKPALLLLDEPTKGLDAESKLVIATALSGQISRGVTVLLATHDLAFAALVADEISMLFDGEATCTESSESFFSNNLFYRAFEDGFTQAWLRQFDVGVLS